MTTLGNWTLLEIVGRGAAATVWSATGSDRTVTVKVADPSDAKATRSLSHEARILGRLDHPNLPHLIDVLESPPALVIDVPPTQTYGELLATGRLWTLTLRQRLETLAVIAAALDRLHEQGIVHRDVKPSHVTVTNPPVLFDFGIAQGAADTNPPDVDAGTAAYMPPPGEPVSIARDAYAFGVTAYELLFGAHPLLVASDRDIAPTVLRQRAAAKIRTGAWRKPTAVPPWELPPDMRNAELDLLDELFSEALGTPEGRPESLSSWVATVRSAVPVGEDTMSIAPKIMPQAFEPAHTAHEVAAALRTGSGRMRDWRVVAGVLIALAAAALLLLRQ